MLKLGEVAEKLRISRATICRWILTGFRDQHGKTIRLSATRVGRGWRVEDKDLAIFLGQMQADYELPPKTTPRRSASSSAEGRELSRALARR